jgi:hypothetical protein
MIARATARLRVRSGSPAEYRLTGLWSADFVPGQTFKRQQVTVQSLHGGESRSQEMWFFPLQEPCGDLRLQECEKKERANFLTWQAFLAGIHTTDPALSLKQTAYEIGFEFAFKEGERVGQKSITCRVEISNTVRRLADADNYKDKGVLSISAPCVS